MDDLINPKSKEIWVESEEGKGSAFYFTIPSNLAKGNECRMQ